MNTAVNIIQTNLAKRRLIFGVLFSILVIGIIISFAPKKWELEPNRFEFLEDPDFADRSEWLQREL